ncbi:hypothetical protein Tco_0431831 [Tanacetum coccineum]
MRRWTSSMFKLAKKVLARIWKEVFESKREWGERGVNEKNKDSDNVVAKDVVVPHMVDKPVVTVSCNSGGTHDGNVVSSTATPVEGTSLMLNSYTSDMCMQSWGMSSYCRAMIELRADMELKDTIVVAMPKLVGE